MKRGWLALAVLVLAVPFVNGQMFPALVKVDVPFDFYVANQAFPAGSYEVASAWKSSLPASMIRNIAGKPVFALLAGRIEAGRNQPDGRVRLIFYRYDNDHAFLRELDDSTSRSSIVYPKSRSEREHVTSTWTPVTGGRPAKVVVLASVR